MAHAKIDILPDEILLEIFSFYLTEGPDFPSHSWRWPTLVHVCRRWRTIVFASPSRLDLRIRCTGRSRVKEMSDIWPALPIDIWAMGAKPAWWGSDNVNNIIAALVHNDRIHRIWVDSIGCWFLERIATAIQDPLPALTHLHMSSWVEMPEAVFPEAFLGGSAPCLRFLFLNCVAFSGIPKLLLTANHLVRLRLSNIPLSGYISLSPEAVVTCLSALANLERLTIQFRFPRSRSEQPNLHPPPLTRIVLPVLAHFRFKCDSEYIEDLVSRIDVPLLDHAHITFFNQPTFVVPRLHDFLSRTECFTPHSHAAMLFDLGDVTFKLKPESLWLEIDRPFPEAKLSLMSQICSSSLHPFSTLERLEICETGPTRGYWPDYIENTDWLDLLHPFIALKDLYLGKELAIHAMLTLMELAKQGRAEYLPTLQNIFIEGLQPSGPIKGDIKQFVAARQLSGRPVAVHRWEKEP